MLHLLSCGRQLGVTALRRIMNMVEMPDKTAENLVRFIRLNEGRLGHKWREGEFEKLTKSPPSRPSSAKPSIASKASVVVITARVEIVRRAATSARFVGYKFGCRHQFGSITDNYAKLLMGSHLWISNITLNFAYLS